MMAKTKRKPFTLAEAKEIGEKLGIDWSAFDVKQFCLGLNTERTLGAYNPVTHFVSNDPIVIGKVVRAQLSKSPTYYTDWAQNEKAAEQAHENKHTS